MSKSTRRETFFVAFANASDALAAAAAGRDALESGPVRVRIGLHTGEPLLTDAGYIGIDVHRAARIMSAGHGGQVLVSEPTRSLLDDGAELVDLGLHRLKDMGQPERLFQLGPGEFPPLKTLDATNLPIAASPLLGRERELDQLLSLLAEPSRLVTITGPGGTGKTRLALQVAAELVGSYSDGVFWVPLASISDSDLVLPTIAQTLGARDELQDHLRGKEVLLLLDNLEHLLLAGPALATLLATSKELRILVTSRSPLRVSGEREYPLEPLRENDAVTLFCERARSVGRALEPSNTVEAICRRLDGLPLAIELAAARTKLLAPDTLLRRLEHALPLLTGGARDAPERQQTLRATIEWSYDLLDEEGRRLFARLSVFAGSFALEPAEEICDAGLDSLSGLVDLSLLKPIGDDRFLMLETIREYAAERLEASGDAGGIRRRHAELFLALVEKAEPHLRAGGDQPQWLQRLEIDYGNVRAALLWWFDSGDINSTLRFVSAIFRFWEIRPRFSEASSWLERAVGIADQGSIDLQSQVLFVAGRMARWRNDFLLAARRLEQALVLFRAAGDDRNTSACLGFLSNVLLVLGERERAEAASTESVGRGRRSNDAATLGAALHNRGLVQRASGNLDAAATTFECALEHFRSLDMSHGVANALVNLGVVELGRGNDDRAQELLIEGLRVSSELGESGWRGMALHGLGEHALLTGDLRAAGSLLIEALTLARDQDDAELMIACLKDLAGLAAVRRDDLRAARLAGAALELSDSLDVHWQEMDRHLWARFLPKRESNRSSDWLQAWETGKMMTLEEAVDYALVAVD